MIYCDCGANDGEDIKRVLSEGKIPKDSRIIAFDVIDFKMEGVEFLKRAVWINNDLKEFSVSPNNIHSSLMPEKRQYNDKDSTKIVVYCIDFSEYIKQFKGQELIIKMDIEGAEYPVLTKMIEDGTIGIPKEIYVEFHCTRDPGLKPLHAKFMELIKNKGIKNIYPLRKLIKY